MSHKNLALDQLEDKKFYLMSLSILITCLFNNVCWIVWWEVTFFVNHFCKLKARDKTSELSRRVFLVFPLPLQGLCFLIFVVAFMAWFNTTESWFIHSNLDYVDFLIIWIFKLSELWIICNIQRMIPMSPDNRGSNLLIGSSFVCSPKMKWKK